MVASSGFASIVGNVVQVIEYGGTRLKRRDVQDLGRVVVVGNEEEYADASAEHREPDGVGSP